MRCAEAFAGYCGKHFEQLSLGAQSSLQPVLCVLLKARSVKDRVAGRSGRSGGHQPDLSWRVLPNAMSPTKYAPEAESGRMSYVYASS